MDSEVLSNLDLGLLKIILSIFIGSIAGDLSQMISKVLYNDQIAGAVKDEIKLLSIMLDLSCRFRPSL
jgi:hypothetical protein